MSSDSGKRLGFQFKGTSKRQKIIETERQQEVDIITTIEGSNINSINPVKEKEVLVIPLVRPAVQPSPPTTTSVSKLETTTTAPLTLDQIAAAELLRDIEQNGNASDDPIDSLVIKQADKLVVDETSGAKKKAPLLMLNVAPELLSIRDENDRFKYDVSSRAEDLNVKSDIYESIPVAQFGAALLRGMGWQGPDKAEARKEEKLVAREQRLGLGAQAKPPDMLKKGKANPLVNSSSSGTSSATAEQRKEEERRRWEKRAEERLKDQKLFDGDFVWLRAPTDLSGKRAEVVAARGVPGLDRVRIQLEHSGRVVEVPRRDCVLLSPSELNDKPFVAAQDSAVQREEQARGLAQTQFRGMSASDSSSNHNRSSAVKQEGTGRNSSSVDAGAGSNRDSKPVPGTGSSSNSGVSVNKEGNKGGSSSAKQSVFWLREGIRVKVVSRSIGGSRAYLQKATVLDVYSRGRASLRLDDGSVLDEVNERHVETIVPAVGGSCVVLLGEHQGQTAVLLERRREQQNVLVQLSEELDLVELDMDSIAATSR